MRTAVFTAVCVVLAAAGHTLASGRAVPPWSLVLGWFAVFAVVAPLAGRERRLPGIAALLAVGQVTLHSVFNVGQMCADSAPAGAAGPSGSATGASGGGLLSVAARLVCGDHAQRFTPAAAGRAVVQAGLDPAGLGAGTHISATAMPGMSMPGMVMPGTGMAGTGMAGMSTPGTDLAGSTAHAAVLPLPAPGHAALSVSMSMCSLPMLLGHLLAALVAGWLLRRGEAALWRLVRLSVRGAAGLSLLSPATALRRAGALLSALAARVPYARRRIRRATREATGRHRTVWLRYEVARRGPPVVVLAA